MFIYTNQLDLLFNLVNPHTIKLELNYYLIFNDHVSYYDIKQFVQIMRNSNLNKVLASQQLILIYP